MLQFKVTGLGIDTRTDHPIVILHSQGDEDLILPIWIGRLEAQSIAIALQGEKLERPLTHDLLLNTIENLGFSMDRVEIHSVFNGTYYAHLILTRKNAHGEPEEVVIDSRPSDSISLALRVKCDIFVSESVKEQSCIPAIVRTFDDEGNEIEIEEDMKDKEEFLKFLDGVKASDFKLPPSDKENRNS